MNCILIGYGEIGKAVKGYFGEYHKIDICDIKEKQDKYLDKYDVMLVALPYSETFVDDVKAYMDEFNVSNVIVFSTVPIGTTRLISGAVHTPIEGKHPDLEKSIETLKFFMGGYGSKAISFFKQAKKRVKVLRDPEHTEFMKLQSTTNYGIQIEYARYLGEVCDELGLDYENIVAYNKRYNELYRKLGMNDLQRQIVTPPEGKIGGHCVLPNAKILQERFPNAMVGNLVEVNK